MSTNDNDCRPEFEAWLASCGKSPLMWNTSDAMLAAWAAATRAALSTQPDAGEPVAWQFEERVYASGIGHVWTEKLEARTPNADRQVRGMTALYAAPPAAAHGDEAVRCATKNLVAVARTIDKEAFAKGTQNVPHGHFRSLDYALQTYDAAMRAQVGEGGE